MDGKRQDNGVHVFSSESECVLKLGRASIEAGLEPVVLQRSVPAAIEHEKEIVSGLQNPPKPALQALRKQYPGISDEERLLRFCLAGDQVGEMRAAGPMRTVYSFERPLVTLLKELSSRKSWHYVRLEIRNPGPAQAAGG